MPDSEEPAQPTRRKRPFYKRIRSRDSWLRDRYDASPADTKEWADADMPPHIDVVAGFLMSNNLVFGVKDKAELFRLDQLRRDNHKMFGAEPITFRDVLRLRYVEPSPIPSVHYTVAAPPIGLGFGDIVEVNYNVRLQALIREMVLTNIEIEHGCKADDGSKVVFRGTEYPGPAINREIRVVRITVHDFGYGYATWEEVASTTYPRSFL